MAAIVGVILILCLRGANPNSPSYRSGYTEGARYAQAVRAEDPLAVPFPAGGYCAGQVAGEVNKRDFQAGCEAAISDVLGHQAR